VSAYSTLVVAESWANRLTAFDIADDGSLSNRRVWAEVDGDGICLDAEGAIWCSGVSGGQPECLRVREGGEVLERIVHDAACLANAQPCCTEQDPEPTPGRAPAAGQQD
jgi:sugar lactone lactonase YvrE